jgi:Protein of unknown function (DUF3570)
MARILGMVTVVVVLLACARVTHADAASGTTTGAVALRGNYYVERSTRVVAPAVSGRIDTPQGVRVDATYLLDAITSASQATGTQSDVGFTEIRNDVQAGAGYELTFGEAQLDVSLRGRVSKEPDYLSRGGGFSAALSLLQRTTVLRLNGYAVHDDVSRVDRLAPAEDPTKLIARRAVRVGTLDAISLGFALDQVLSPTRTLTLGFDESILSGFTANPYRVVAFADGGGRAEGHPRERFRHAPYLSLAEYFPRTRSALRAGYRLYKDNWDILAHAAELRMHQELGSYLELRGRYRYYTQRAAFFYRPERNLRADRYITADPKMSAFHDHTLGLQARLGLSFLRQSPLSRLAAASLDFSFDYIFNTNRYGNGLMAQAGLIWGL